jgi:hypothetical protein
MREAKSNEPLLLNQREFANGLFALGYDLQFGILVFNKIVSNVSSELEPTESFTRLTRPFKGFSFIKEGTPEYEALKKSHERMYSQTYQVRQRLPDSITFNEEDRNGVIQTTVCLQNLAVIAEDLGDVTGMGPKSTQATFDLLALHDLYLQDQ